MKVDGWKYYNHAVIPTTAPHEKVDLTPINNGSIWRIGGGYPILARWTTDFDCGYETEWWYVIKDDPFDINALKSKRRYEINKGNRNFDVKIVNPFEYKEELYLVTKEAYEAYPLKYRPNLTRETFDKWIESWDKHEVYGAFYRDNQELCGYAWIDVFSSYINFCALKTKPAYEKYALNAALVYAIIEKYNNRLGSDFYVCDGERATLHETKFQDYLEKYFGFRKAYCKLHIKYRFPFGLAVKLLYPFSNYLNKDGKLGSRLIPVLTLEKYSRQAKSE